MNIIMTLFWIRIGVRLRARFPGKRKGWAPWNIHGIICSIPVDLSEERKRKPGRFFDFFHPTLCELRNIWIISVE